MAEHPTRPRAAYVCELTGLIDLSGWPEGSRLLCRRECAHAGALLSLIDTDGLAPPVLLTDQAGDDIAELDRLHRATPTSSRGSRTPWRRGWRSCRSAASR